MPKIVGVVEIVAERETLIFLESVVIVIVIVFVVGVVEDVLVMSMIVGQMFGFPEGGA